jgi:hypothetical protein
MSKKPKIKVGRVGKNVKNYVNIRVDRKTPLGNPCIMRNESNKERNRVIKNFKDLYLQLVKIKKLKIRKETIKIYKILKSGKNVNLQCWCYPKPCHADIIKEFLEQFI